MLFRVSGRLNDGKRFAARMEAPSAIQAIGQTRAAFQEAGVPETDVARIGCQPVKGGKSLKISEPGKPRAARTAKKSAK